MAALLTALAVSLWLGFVALGELEASRDRLRSDAPPTGEDAYDVVVTVHHDDMDTFVDWGVVSIATHFADLPDDAKIFAIGTPRAHARLTSIKRDKLRDSSDEVTISAWRRVYPVEETIYPFNMTNIGDNRNQNKPTWIFQQLLKLYARRALTAAGIRMRRSYVVLDSDTVLVKDIRMQEPDTFVDEAGHRRRRNFACISSDSAGAFRNDCDIAPPLVKEVLGPDWHKAFIPPPHNATETFTAICHHMLFDGQFLDELLDHIEARSGEPPWVALGSLKVAHGLSEYELYLAWVRRRHPRTVAARQLPYVNWGRADATSLGLAARYGAAFLTNHDDWGARNLCCVNGLWPAEAAGELSRLRPSTPACKCCPAKQTCAPPRIDCRMLGIDGCRDVLSGEGETYMVFDAL